MPALVRKHPDTLHDQKPFSLLKTAFVAIAMLLLTACRSVGPDYVVPTPPVPDAWMESTSPEPQLAEPQLAPCTLSTWWTDFDDPMLTQLITQALDANLDLRQARTRLHEAQAQRRRVDANRGPTDQLNADFSRSTSSETIGNGSSVSRYDIDLGVSWEIDLFGGLRRASEAALADEEAAAASLDDVQAAIAAQVGLEYLELRRAQERLRIAKASVELQRQTLELTEWREQAGLETEVAVAQARSNLEQTRASLPSFAASIAGSQYRLAFLTAQLPSALPATLLDADTLPQPPDVIPDPPAEVLRRRPDLRAAERALAAETARVGQATADLYPRLTLRGSLGLEALSLDDLGDDGSGTSSLLGGLVAPLLDRRQLRAQVDISSARQEAALLRYEATLLQILEEVESTAATVHQSRERLDTLSRAVNAAREAGELARLQYESGLLDFQAVLDTDRTLFTLEDSVASARADVASGVIQLYRALGGGWQPNECTFSEKEPQT